MTHHEYEAWQSRNDLREIARAAYRDAHAQADGPQEEYEAWLDYSGVLQNMDEPVDVSLRMSEKCDWQRWGHPDD